MIINFHNLRLILKENKYRPLKEIEARASGAFNRPTSEFEAGYRGNYVYLLHRDEPLGPCEGIADV